MQNHFAKSVNLAKSHSAKITSAFQPKRDAANPREEINNFKFLHLSSFLIFEPPLQRFAGHVVSDDAPAVVACRNIACDDGPLAVRDVFSLRSHNHPAIM